MVRVRNGIITTFAVVAGVAGAVLARLTADAIRRRQEDQKHRESISS